MPRDKSQLKILTTLLLVFIGFSSAVGQESKVGSAIETEVESQKTDQAIQRGIEFLLKSQREDGSIADRSHETAMSSLAIMAMASTGILPGDSTPEGEASRKALAFVLKDDRQDKDGYFGNRDGSRMYGHGIITLMLTEMLGMGADETQDRLIHERCQKGIDLILSAQKQKKSRLNQGGWRYTPNSNDSDLSVSVWQLMALRSAKNDGLRVPSSSIDEAVAYLRRSYTSRFDPSGQPLEKFAGFAYTPDQRQATFTMTAAGLLAMQVCGEYDSPVVLGATEWLAKNPPKGDERFFYYGTYYYSQGMHQRGGEQGANAEKRVRDSLLSRQKEDGSWVASHGEEASAGSVYSTCMAILSLSVRYHYLPIYQR